MVHRDQDDVPVLGTRALGNIGVSAPAAAGTALRMSVEEELRSIPAAGSEHNTTSSYRDCQPVNTDGTRLRVAG